MMSVGYPWVYQINFTKSSSYSKRGFLCRKCCISVRSFVVVVVVVVFTYLFDIIVTHVAESSNITICLHEYTIL